MIQKTKELNFKDVEGKKIKRHYFNHFCLLLYAVPLFICSIEPIFWEAIPFFPIVCLFLFLSLCILFVCDNFFGKTLCILSEQQLYFNHLALVEKTASGKKKEYVCSGSIGYEDIKSMIYFPPNPRFRRSKIQPQMPQTVILQGADFQLTIPYGNKRLIRQLKKRQKELGIYDTSQEISDFTQLEHKREGIWKEIWDRFKKYKALDIFDKDIKITEFYNSEKDNYISITVQSEKYEFIFDIHETELIMMADHNNNGCDIQLSEIPDINALYTHMQNFIATNSD